MISIETLALARSPWAAASRVVAPSPLLFLVLLASGCNSLPNPTTTTSTSAQPNGPQTYLAPYVVGDATQFVPASSVSAYQLDDTAQTFSKSSYYVGQNNSDLVQYGARTFDAGTTTKLVRGLLSLGMEYSWNPTSPVTYNQSPLPSGGWAVELPNQAGGLIQISVPPAQESASSTILPVEPMVAATSCPDFATPQTYQFITLPAPLPATAVSKWGKAKLSEYAWNPAQETAYGSVDVGGSGSAITFNSIQQYAFPKLSAAGLGASGPPTNIVTSPQAGACTSTYYGYTTAVPGNLSVTDPGPNTESAPPVSLVGIGPTGLLVQSNAADGEQAVNTTTPLAYENLLGAGTGAIGLPKPSSALSTSALVGAQYLGFFYGSGSFGSSNWSTYVASFGFAGTPPLSCSAANLGVPATNTDALLYGGDFPNNNPGSAIIQSQSNPFNPGFPTDCDFAIDLGAQDANNNGLFPVATVYVGENYAPNQTGGNYNFPAVAIAGQLGGKYAIFLVGIDTAGSPKQAWGIYLLQSN